MKAIIFASSKETNNDYIKKLISDDYYIVSCDGGLGIINDLNLKPNVLIGDFDSVKMSLLDQFYDVPKVEYDSEKDFSDLELAINHCKDHAYKDIFIFGALGGRMDHCLSNIQLLQMYNKKGLNITLFDEINEIFFTTEDVRIQKKHKYLSLVALTKDCIVTIKGVKYELYKEHISGRPTFTISNEIIEEFANLYVHSGELLVIQSSDKNLSI